MNKCEDGTKVHRAGQLSLPQMVIKFRYATNRNKFSLLMEQDGWWLYQQCHSKLVCNPARNIASIFAG